MKLKKKYFGKRARRWAISLFIVLSLILFWQCLPSPLFNRPFSLVVLDREGKLLSASIASDEQWRFPPVDKATDKFEKAIICYEDKRFYYHPGVDPLAVFRAIRLNFKTGHTVSGASTITMQVIRLSRNGRPRTLKEKLIEIVMAARLEVSASKKEILALFASHAPFGGNVVGIDAASWRYFGCSPDRLSWAETAMLAVLPNSPSLIHPGKNRAKLITKRNALLDRMEASGIIDSLTCALAKEELLPPRPHPIPDFAPHLGNRLKRSVKSSFDNRYRFQTTLNKRLQVRSAEIIKRHHKLLASNGINNAAAIILEVKTGNVLSYVGNIHDLRDREHGNFVDIITAPRSTGSILKPLLYAAMLQEGEILPSSLIPDIPTRMGGFAPQNYSQKYQGAVPAYMALARSLNIPAVRMLKSFGVDRFYLLLKKLGMTTLYRPADDYGLTLILGGAEGTLWDITSIYAGMALSVNNYFNENQNSVDAFIKPKLLLNEQEEDFEHKLTNPLTKDNSSDFPLKPASCWLAFQAMLEVVRPGEESSWRNFTSSKKIAWKTGTSYGYRDGWAVGVSPEYAIGVWVGNADGEGRPGLTGVSAAAPILFELFGLIEDTGWFECPENDLVEISVCKKSGYRAGPQCADTKKELIPFAGLHSEPCPYCRTVHCDKELNWRVNSQCERIADIGSVNWFVLPPAMEWYYRLTHSDYKTLPPFRRDCVDLIPGLKNTSMSFIYPSKSGQIYVPVELDGQRGRTVFEVAHRDPEATIFWHLDEQYLDLTHGIHQMAIAPKPGKHTLTLVDENGEVLTMNFKVLSKERP